MYDSEKELKMICGTNNNPTHVCVSCHSEIIPKKFTPGSLMVEILLWCFFGFGVFYSLWRISARHKVCPECQSKNFISLTSVNGKRLAYGSVSTGS